ncbi:MAG: integron integrase [Pseudomonadota bacterium]
MNVAIITKSPVKANSPRLRDEFAGWMRMKNYRDNTIRDYVSDVLDFVMFNGKRDPRTLGPAEVQKFLTMLAVERNVSWKTQNQNLCALVKFYDGFLNQPLGDIGKFMAASKPAFLPVVFSKDEVMRVLAAMRGATKLCAQLQYGCGLRVGEVVRLRVKDIDFGRMVVSVLDAKGGKHRQLQLPTSMVEPLREHLARLKLHFDQDGGWLVELPNAYGVKNPGAARAWEWQYVFSARDLTNDPRDGVLKRYHIFEETVQRAVKIALGVAGITKKAGTHTFRHSFATHLLESGVPIYDVQKLLGHSRVETTMIYNHVAAPIEKRIKSPLDP